MFTIKELLKKILTTKEYERYDDMPVAVRLVKFSPPDNHMDWICPQAIPGIHAELAHDTDVLDNGFIAEQIWKFILLPPLPPMYLLTPMPPHPSQILPLM